MRFHQNLHRFRRDVPRCRSRTRPVQRFAVEGLEERALLTTLFYPVNGAETANYGGGSLLGTVSWGMPIYTIYWGSYWGTSNGQTLQSEIQDSLNPIFYYSNYLSGLNQYNVPYPAGVSGSGTVEVNNYSDPSNGFTSSDIQNVISYAINDQGLPDSNAYSNVGLYVVLTPPGISSSDSGAGGYHTYYTGNGNVRDYAWIGDVYSSGLNDYTYVLSHEVQEAMTDPHGDAWQVLPRNNNSWNEICDNEAQNYTELLDGYEVQSHWSQSDGEYAIQDDNSQTLYAYNGGLYVYGDQLGSNYNDVITLDLNGYGGELITLNSETFSYPYGEFNHVYVYTEGGSNTVYVDNTSSSCPVTIYGDGSDYDSIGNSYDGVQGIYGSVDVHNPPDYTDLVINDTADYCSGHAVTVDQTGVYGLAPAAITYNEADLSFLTIETGSAGNTFYVDNTPSNGFGVETTIGNYSGAGSNDFYVYGTGGPLYLDGGAGFQSVDVGVGGLAGIDGLVDVYNSSPSGVSYLTIDDSLDTTGQAANLDDGELTGLGSPAPIEWSASSSATGGVINVAVLGGSGGNTFDVNNTSNLYGGTYLSPGTGSNYVEVLDTTGPLNVNGGAGSATVLVGGNGTLAGINGLVYVFNSSSSGSSALYIDDNLDTTGQIANLYDGELTGLGSPAPIEWSPSSSSTGGVTDVAVYGGSGGNTFDVNNTSNLYGGTYLYTGSGTNTVNDIKTTGALQIGGSGTDTLVGPNVNSTWSLTGANSGSVGNVSFTGIANLTGGTGNDAFDFSGGGSLTGAVKGGGGTNTLIGPNTTNTWSITTSNGGNLNGMPFSTIQNLRGGTGADTFKFSNGKGVTGTINGGAGTDTLNYSAYSTGVTVNLGAGTATGTGGVSAIENVTGSPSNDSITGSSGNNVLSGDGGNDVLNGGSGGNDTFILASTQGSSTTVTGNSTGDTLDGANIANTWTLTGVGAGTVNGIAFTGINNLVGGANTDTFKFNSGGSVSGTINGGGGSNTLDYSNHGATAITVNLQTHTATATGGFSNIGTLVGSSSTSDTLIGPNTTNTWTLTGTNAGTVGTFSFSAVENLTGGTGNDTFKFNAGAAVTGKITGGAGTNTLNYAAYTTAVTVNMATGAATGTGGYTGIKSVVGGSGANTLIGPNATNTWNITGTNAGNVAGLTFSAFQNLTGGTGMDIFKFSAGKNVTGAINGGGGGDWLDYSLYTTAVTVNLATGVATGVGGGVTNVHNVRGGKADNTITGDSTGGILIGGAGNDTITGGSGRSILIGDKGVDTVKGGSKDDIVIGGYTDYDTSSTVNDQALEAILAEWQLHDPDLEDQGRGQRRQVRLEHDGPRRRQGQHADRRCRDGLVLPGHPRYDYRPSDRRTDQLALSRSPRGRSRPRLRTGRPVSRPARAFLRRGAALKPNSPPLTRESWLG
jgi:hypothetical protein